MTVALNLTAVCRGKFKDKIHVGNKFRCALIVRGYYAICSVDPTTLSNTVKSVNNNNRQVSTRLYTVYI